MTKATNFGGMRPGVRRALAIVLIATVIPASGDVITLKTGQKIEAPVLKETGAALYIDLGIDVVRIPVAKIDSRTKGPVKAKAEAAAKLKRNRIYSTGRLTAKPIKELARQFGAGVVLVQTTSGLGSGFILNVQGLCVTNYHVVEKETRIAVVVFDRDKQGKFTRRRIDKVKILALNPFFDLALLEIPVQKDLPFKPVVLTGAHDHREGDEVFAIGNPLGLERSVSRGIVSTRNRNFSGLAYIQMTAQINPGNSGGPLFNSRGEVIGVTNMGIPAGEGLGFAIPATYVKHFLDNNDAWAFDKDNPNTGFRYQDAPRRKNPKPPPTGGPGK
ncbi:MAG: trypsin-like peptidase domain-containing protein [Planctomycetaceae bacterium]|nr:trypsin-like peptidase domain-containing protein [Planctomycetaceae bacterium]